MDYPNPDALVSPEWLEQHLEAPDVHIVDATYFLPSQDRNAREEYEEVRIPGAVFFPIDEIADPDTDLPHNLPSAERFASKVADLGLGDGVRIVCYDANGLASAAARVWWMFRVFGHEDVAVLNGGLPRWFREQRPLEEFTDPPRPTRRHFTPRTNHLLVRDREQVRANIDSRREQLVDGRPADRFRGTAEETWPVTHYGHVPGAYNVPFLDLMDNRELTMLPPDQLRQRFADAGVDLDRPVTTMCGSGVTAAVVNLALYLLGHKEAALYDGSWVEWGNDDSVPVETGDAA